MSLGMIVALQPSGTISIRAVSVIVAFYHKPGKCQDKISRFSNSHEPELNRIRTGREQQPHKRRLKPCKRVELQPLLDPE